MNELKNGDYYYFDCLDGDLPSTPVTLEHVKKLVTYPDIKVDERYLVKLAANYEADLWRLTYKDNEVIDRKRIYNAWASFDNTSKH